jgi:integrase/recombinase XerD
MQKLKFKEIAREETVKPADMTSLLEAVRAFMLYERRLSPYNTKQAIALLKKVLKTYQATTPSKELGHRIEKDLSSKGKKPRTIRNYLTVVELWAASQGVKDVNGNPLKFRMPKIEGHRIDSLTAGETRALLDYGAETLRDNAIIHLLVYCCLRGKELINADVEDVDLVNRVFYVRSKYDTDIVSPGTKTHRERTVVMSKECARALKAYVEEGRPNIPTKALFFTNRGSRIASRTLQDIVRDAARRAGIRRKVYPYLLRHTGCTLMCKSNINLLLISRMMGHSNIQQTLAYSHPDDLALREEIYNKLIL